MDKAQSMLPHLVLWVQGDMVKHPPLPSLPGEPTIGLYGGINVKWLWHKCRRDTTS